MVSGGSGIELVGVGVPVANPVEDQGPLCGWAPFAAKLAKKLWCPCQLTIHKDEILKSLGGHNEKVENHTVAPLRFRHR